MNLRQYFGNLSLLFFFNFAVKPIWVFGLERNFQIIVGNKIYGAYFSFISLIYIFSVFLDIGLHNYTVKTIAENKSHYKSYVTELWLSKGILILVYFALILITIFLEDWNSQERFLFFLIAVQMAIFSIYQFLRNFVQGLQLLRLDSFLSSLDRIFLILLGSGILFLYIPHYGFSIYHFVGFHILAFLMSIISLLWLIRNKIGFQFQPFSLKQLIGIIRKGWLLIIITLLMSVYTRIDAVMLEKMLPNGDEQCGILALSYRIIDSAYNALALLSVFLLPTVAFHFSEKKYTYIRKVVGISFILSTILALGFIGISLLFGDKIYEILYPSNTKLAVEVFKIQSWTVLGVGWIYIFGSYLTAIGKFKALVVIVSIGVILSLGLNYHFIPIQKVLGVANVSTIVQLSMGILHLLAAVYYLYQYKNENEFSH